jgi:2-polyprenyl-3-methyl-5-hydroxy-6-metoxy-1,4-benzoquinol methylase
MAHNFLSRFTGSGLDLRKEDWEKQYQQGDWDFFKTEENRYQAIAKWIQAGSVLDLGCGEGWLRRYIPTQVHLTGVDISSFAIEKARAQFPWSEGNEWIVGDVSQIEIDQTFSVVLFNESLNYCTHPMEQVARWLKQVAPGGILLLSLYDCQQNRSILRQLDKRWPANQKELIREDEKKFWTLVVIRTSV